MVEVVFGSAAGLLKVLLGQCRTKFAIAISPILASKIQLNKFNCHQSHLFFSLSPFPSHNLTIRNIFSLVILSEIKLPPIQNLPLKIVSNPFTIYLISKQFQTFFLADT